MRAAKITFAAAAVLGLAVGVAWGYYTAEQLSELMESSLLIFAESTTSDFAVQQLEHANTDHARRAVQLQITILERAERATSAPAYKRQLGYAYTRLAMVEQAAGEAQAERAALDQARVWFNQKELRDDQMKKALKLLDGASHGPYADIK